MCLEANILDNTENISIFAENSRDNADIADDWQKKRELQGVLSWQLNALTEEQHASLSLTIMTPSNFMVPPTIRRVQEM